MAGGYCCIDFDTLQAKVQLFLWAAVLKSLNKVTIIWAKKRLGFKLPYYGDT